ncbi:protein of unknown function [Natronincola peptidivorans]|uniref:Uncharacterized protein n=2 Tax=Natronincola peptidivorans TaxID=426128 RepID=A0A1I0F0M8_9FIRM|nr:protein of unknown function [Natronincola peptidivorans]
MEISNKIQMFIWGLIDDLNKEEIKLNYLQVFQLTSIRAWMENLSNKSFIDRSDPHTRKSI